jgi:hypothetical protein
MNREDYLSKTFPTTEGVTYIQSLDSYNRKPNALNHDDTIDREFGKEFLEERGWYGIEYGGKYDLDLEVPQFKRGCDVEMNNYNHYETFKSEGVFRLPARKERYWLNTGSNYSDWKVDYIQFSNNDVNELLWYPYKLIEHYVHNRVTWEGLKKKGYSDIMSTFITIPFDDGIKYIQHWKNENGIWIQIIH